MNPAMEFIACQVMTPTAVWGAAANVMVACPGDSLQVRNAPQGAHLLNWWYRWNDPAALIGARIAITSALLHDQTWGINRPAVATFAGGFQSGCFPQEPLGVGQPLYGQDVLLIRGTGSAVATEVQSLGLLLYYPELQGSTTRLIDEHTMVSRRKQLFDVNVALAPGALAGPGGYRGAVAINALIDLFRPNTDYAILGCTTNALPAAHILAVTIRGSDTGGLRLGIPINTLNQEISRQWFLDLARSFRQPLIPVMNSSSRANTFIELVCAEAAIAAGTTFTFHLVELSR